CVCAPLQWEIIFRLRANLAAWIWIELRYDTRCNASTGNVILRAQSEKPRFPQYVPHIHYGTVQDAVRRDQRNEKKKTLKFTEIPTDFYQKKTSHSKQNKTAIITSVMNKSRLLSR